MDAKIKADWVKALRSGEYKQGRGKLYRSNECSFCCLGVLNAIRDAHQGYRFNEIGIAGNKEDLLINMNDSDDKSFSEIADYIEQNL